ncbi:inositol monophosphatase [Nocardioides sp. YIM 152588]|uniref:inositol monophosphatase family protein n=1 Tax=Nocardioides sp. YIM 152588 TaxID=3158259 RepID=UPI0032E44CCD
MNDVDLAATLARRAGRTAHEMLQAGVEGWRKSSAGDLVTAADHAAEELVAAALAEARPGDGVVGEEGAASEATTGRTWFVDPVDGTYNFVNGLTWWCSALALQESGEVVLGAVYHPHDDQVWVGGRDLPTARNGEAVARLADRSLADCSLTTYLHRSYFASADVAEPFGSVAAAAKVVRAGGSGSMDLAAVADGRLDLWCQHDAAEWDWMPGFALVEGAGGAVAHVEARGITWSLAGPPTAVREAADLLRSA